MLRVGSLSSLSVYVLVLRFEGLDDDVEDSGFVLTCFDERRARVFSVDLDLSVDGPEVADLRALGFFIVLVLDGAMVKSGRGKTTTIVELCVCRLGRWMLLLFL
jgi:hypothetical protein